MHLFNKVLSGCQTIETLCPCSNNNWHSWNTLISCPPQPVAASECTIWRVFNMEFEEQKWLVKI